MALPPPHELLKNAREMGLDRDLAPIAVSATLIDGYAADDDRTLLEPSMLLTPVPNPVLAALLDTSGATRRGRMSWLLGMGEDNYTPTPLLVVRDRLLPGTLYLEATTVARNKPLDLHAVSKRNAATALENHFRGTDAYPVMRFADAHHNTGAAHPLRGAGKYGAVTLSGDHRVTWIKIVTHNLVVPEGLPQVPLNLRPSGRPFTDPRPVRPVEAIQVLEWLASEGITVVDPSEDGAIAKLRRRLSTSVVAFPVPGRPAMAQASVGRAVHGQLPRAEAAVFAKPAPGKAVTVGQLTARQVMDLAGKLPDVPFCVHPGTADAGALALAEPVEDERLRGYQREAVGRHVVTNVGLLNACSPGMGKTVISYAGMQRRAVGTDRYRALVVCEANVRQQWVDEATTWFPEARMVRVESRSDAPALARALHDSDQPVVAVISYGLLAAVKDEMNRRNAVEDPFLDDENAGDPGANQTPQLEDMLDGTDLASPAHTDTPSDVQVTATVTPKAPAAADIVYAVTPAVPGQMDLFEMLLEAAADTSQTVQASQDATGSTGAQEEDDEFANAHLGAVLLDTFWHDIVADEAEVLRSTGSKQAAAMWQLRRNSGVALVLTGTPINRGIDDLGRLVAWVRNDEHLFAGVRLSTQFDLGDDESLAQFTQAMGPILFRRDTSEIADELPTIEPVVMKLTPSSQEKALAGAARDELKRVYEELMAALEVAESLDPDNPEFEQARQGLAAARGAWLGGTTLARMASSDPAALVGSKSAGALLLAGQGLIQAATAQAGTKRTAVVNDVCERVANGEKVLIFTEFATVARGVIDDLDNAGVRVGEVLGGGGKKRDRMVAGFQAGELDVLVCTSSGERGLNLQQASTIVHYDLPWTPKGVIQRTGRAVRIKSQNQSLTVVFPLMEGTIEERVAAMVVSRAVEAMRALDASRGVDTTRTEMGQALGGLVSALDGTSTGRKQQNQLMEITAALVA